MKDRKHIKVVNDFELYGGNQLEDSLIEDIDVDADTTNLVIAFEKSDQTSKAYCVNGEMRIVYEYILHPNVA